jgi:hypothetical protein
MTHPPCAASCDATAHRQAHYERIRKVMALRKTTTKTRGRRDRKTVEIKNAEENRRRKSTTFKPPSSNDFQNAADNLLARPAGIEPTTPWFVAFFRHQRVLLINDLRLIAPPSLHSNAH